MARVELTEDTLKWYREQFPESLVGIWSTFGDGYQMEFGCAATFHRDGTGLFEQWEVLEEDSREHRNAFYWTVKDGFEVEVAPRDCADAYPSDWGSFVVDFYIGEDAYGNKFVAIRDKRGAEGSEPFWWFMDPAKHPMQRFGDDMPHSFYEELFE